MRDRGGAHARGSGEFADAEPRDCPPCAQLVGNRPTNHALLTRQQWQILDDSTYEDDDAKEEQEAKSWRVDEDGR
jgi:hypothetical protein